MDVILCEKPDQGKAVAAFKGITAKKKGYIEGKGIIVTWCIGHLFELFYPEDYDKKWKKWDADLLPIIPENIQYKPAKGKSEQIKIVKSCLKKATRVIIATDGDREGEAIARIIIDKSGYKGPMLRAWMNSTDQQSIKETFDNLFDAKESYVHGQAALGRAALDWMVGMNFSRAIAANITQKNTFRVAYGRVLTPTLNILVEREKAIKHFKPESHFQVMATFGTHAGQFSAKWLIPDEVRAENGLLMESDVAQYVCQHVANNQGTVSLADYTPKKESSPLPFKLGDLISEASKYGVSPASCQQAIQKLYDPPLSLVTYPRTDSKYLPESMLSWVPDILSNAGKLGYEEEIKFIDPRKKGKCWNTNKVTAHHGIIPTRKLPQPDELKGELKTVYDIILRRFLMQFAPERELASSEIEVKVGMMTFRTAVSTEMFPGWKALVGPQGEDEHERQSETLPRLQVGQSLLCSHGEVIKKQTKKPKRFTTSGIIKEMDVASKYCANPVLAKRLKEDKGIGTEATRTGIVVGMESKKLITTDKKGIITVPWSVVQFFDNHIPSNLKIVDNTAIMEIALDAVSSGDLPLKEFIAAQKDYVRETVAKLLRNDGRRT